MISDRTPTFSEPDRSFSALLQSLHELTRGGKLHWQDTPREDEFICVLKAGSVEIAKRFQLDEESLESTPWFEATLLNKDGRVVQSLRSSELEGQNAALLCSLFEAARSQARQSDRVLDELFQEVDSLG